MLYRIAKPLLFSLAPERAHQLTVGALKATLAIPLVNTAFRAQFRLDTPALERELFGLRFPNPVGLAAGFDKDGRYYHHMAALGFGFLELGTVTPKPQLGNPQPRLFRLPKDRALINRMGFNNEGVDALARRLEKYGRPGKAIIGGNIGKNKVTPNETAVDDYRYCFQRLHATVDYFVVNVSSPNTPNLRALQEKEPLTRLLSELQDLNEQLAPQSGTRRPLLLKIAPDLNAAQLDDIISIAAATQLDGIIATNTTIARSPLQLPKAKIEAIGAGGLSGAPVRDRSTEVIRYLYQQSDRQLKIIGVGGIDSPAAALEKLAAGAALIQLYSGLVYAGPGLVRDIKGAILKQGK
ncbi:MAG: quinone-dependent dihydroorotate dehydrogenase [Bacteroidota bacterium]